MNATSVIATFAARRRRWPLLCAIAVGTGLFFSCAVLVAAQTPREPPGPAAPGAPTAAEPAPQDPLVPQSPPAPQDPPAPKDPTAAPGPPAPTPTGPRGPADPAGLGTYDVLGGSNQVTSGTAFNPAISVIPDGVYANDSQDGGLGELLQQVDGFAAAHGEESEAHAHGAIPERGFSLREAEITFSGSVDAYFDVWAIFAVADGEIEVEEGYFQTRRLLPGFQLKAGKFYSGFGYLNRQHPHQWDFVDQALPYEMLFGGSLNEAGIQLTWLPSLPVYAQLGIEALQGTNERLSAQLGPGEAAVFGEKAGPRLLTGWLKVSPDVGYGNALQLGASFAHARQHQELVGHEPAGEEAGHADEAFQGNSKAFGVDAVWKHDSARPYGKGDLTVQTEYLRRIRDLSLVGSGGEPASGEELSATQDGFYAQAVYGFAQRLTLGLRYDVAGLANRLAIGAQESDFGSSRRFSANLTFNPTEFSRLRLQYTRGGLAVGGGRQKYDQVYAQFQMSLGAHGAHRF